MINEAVLGYLINIFLLKVIFIFFTIAACALHRSIGIGLIACTNKADFFSITTSNAK